MSKKAERGTKRVCGSCEAKFYDLNKDPAICPLCGTVFEPEVVAAKPPRASTKVAKPAEEEAEAKTEEEPETVSLEDVAASEESDIDIDDDVLVDIDDEDSDIPSAEDDDTFLEEDEDSGNVSDIVGTPVKDNDDG